MCSSDLALREGGMFLFDMNMEEKYKSHGSGSFGIVEDDHACILQASYRPDEKIGQTDLTLFRLFGGEWRRSDLGLRQTWYAEEEIRSALEGVGFTEVQAYDAQRGLEGLNLIELQFLPWE